MRERNLVDGSAALRLTRLLLGGTRPGAVFGYRPLPAVGENQEMTCFELVLRSLPDGIRR